MHLGMTYRQLCRRTAIRSKCKEGVCKSRCQTDKCKVDAVWDTAVSKRIAVDIREIFQSLEAVQTDYWKDLDEDAEHLGWTPVHWTGYENVLFLKRFAAYIQGQATGRVAGSGGAENEVAAAEAMALETLLKEDVGLVDQVDRFQKHWSLRNYCDDWQKKLDSNPEADT